MTPIRDVPLPVARSPVVTARSLIALTKPRVAIASILTALVGYAATPGHEGLGTGLILLLGAGLAAGGTLAFNQWWERDTDPLMERTRGRPLVQSAISPELALAWSLVLMVGGVLLLAAEFNVRAAAVAAAICGIYGFVYTPMKRLTRWATEVGSLSGALPPLLGSAAAGDMGSTPALILALVLLLWQMPHFFAIGWIYRADYRAARLPLLPATDATGHRTALWSLVYCGLLSVVLVVAWPLGWAGAGFGLTGMLSAGALMSMAWEFYKAEGARDREARRLFRATLVTLMALMAALVLLPP